MTAEDLLIFSVFHKEYPVPVCDFIEAIQVGKSNVDLGFLSDSSGDNIAYKNDRFCELTALYWIWKNVDTLPYKWIGLAHYRRYFILQKKGKLGFKRSDYQYCGTIENYIEEIISPDLKNSFIKNLKLNNIIVPKATPLILEKYPLNIQDHFIYCHLREDWENLQRTIFSLYPEYENSFNLFKLQRKMYCYNMFIGSKDFIKNYSHWLFTILLELEKSVKPSPYPYQNRIFGFFGERMLNLYILHHKLQRVEYPVVQLI